MFKPGGRFKQLHKNSHLSRSIAEAALTDLEFALHHLQEAYGRSCVELHALVLGERFLVIDGSVIHVLRMQDRPKSASEIAAALNKDNTSNVLYSLRKLQKMGLVRQVKNLPRSQMVYEITERGRQVTDEYAELRQEMLLSNVTDEEEFAAEIDHAVQTIIRLVGRYDYAARRASMFRPGQAEVERPSAGRRGTARARTRRRPRKASAR